MFLPLSDHKMASKSRIAILLFSMNLHHAII